jgi:hypothetical protein
MAAQGQLRVQSDSGADDVCSVDAESHNVGTNTRLRWTILPGNDHLIVLNRRWQKLNLEPHALEHYPRHRDIRY